VWPVRVQGETSAAEVARAIDGFNALPENGLLPRPDLIIVARGGGSLEDLWSFNEEIVVRAAAASMIPLISAVGHETDFTLIDFAADYRAPTPTGAAEKAVPVRADLIAELMSKARRALACWQRGIEQRRKELAMLSRALPAPNELLSQPRQRLDSCADRLPRALIANAQIHHRQLDRAASRLTKRLLTQRIERCKEQTSGFGARASRVMLTLLDQRAARLERADRLLEAYSYRNVLERGFALVRDGEGHSLRRASAVSSGTSLDIEFADGRVGAVAAGEARMRPVSKPLPRRRGGSDNEGQGSLFGS
jgi:exodeoxyribonuclease VII large subunit